MALVIFAAALTAFLWLLVHRTRRRYGRTTRGAPGVDYTRAASFRELVAALTDAGVLELAAGCVALLLAVVLLLALQALP